MSDNQPTEPQTLDSSHSAYNQKRLAEISKQSQSAAHPPKSKRSRLSSSNFTVKAGMIAALILLFMVGISFVSSLVSERQNYASSVVSGIKKSHVGAQHITTPIVLVPQTTYTPCKEQVRRDGKLFDRLTTCERRTVTHAVPTRSDWQHSTQVTGDKLRRGIYHAISYDNTVQLSAQFDFTHARFKDQKQVNAAGQTTGRTTHWGEAKVILPISDLRGVKTIPVLSIAGKRYSFTYPEKEEYLGLGYVESFVPQLAFGKSPVLTFDFELQGISALSITPLGKAFTMHMSSNWADPKFTGDALPETRSIDQSGFIADWKGSYLSVANTQMLSRCMSKLHDSCSALQPNLTSQTYTTEAYADDRHSSTGVNTVNIQFIDAVNTYVFTDRVIKYALMLLLVVFGAFFIFEVLKSLRIHPVQYSLVAAALLVFYLLLLSLSEHISFGYAYLIAAGACVSLLGWYVYYVLGNVARASIFTAVLTALYGCFYTIIQSESDSLVIGSIFCFVTIAAAMYFTRHIDWYSATGDTPEPAQTV